MFGSSRPVALGALLLASTANCARAQDAAPLTPAQTESLQQALGLPDPALLAPDGGRVTVLGDGYVLRLPLDGGRAAAQIWGADYALRAKPLDGGRWAFDQLTLPPRFRVGPDGSDRDPGIRLRLTDATFAATADPSYSTAGSSRLGFAGMSAVVFDMHAYAAAQALTIESGAGKVDGDVAPSVAGRSDERGHAELANIRITAPTREPVHVLAGGFRVDWQLGGVDHAAVLALRAGTDALARAMNEPVPMPVPVPVPTPVPVAPDAPAAAAPDAAPAPPAPVEAESAPGAPPAAVRAVMRQLMPLARATFTSSNMSAEADQLNVIAGDDPSVHVDRVRLSLVGAAPAGKLDIALGVTVEGLSIPDERELAGLIPRRIVLSPHVSGVSVDDVSAIVDRLIDNPSFGADNLSDAVVALLSHGPVRLSLDGSDVDLGPTHLHATGAIATSSLRLHDATGTADVTATRLDALIQRLSLTPARREAFQALVFLKGLGKAEGDRTTWRVDFRGGKLLVNGQDFSAIIPVAP